MEFFTSLPLPLRTALNAAMDDLKADIAAGRIVVPAVDGPVAPLPPAKFNPKTTLHGMVSVIGGIPEILRWAASDGKARKVRTGELLEAARAGELRRLRLVIDPLVLVLLVGMAMDWEETETASDQERALNDALASRSIADVCDKHRMAKGTVTMLRTHRPVPTLLDFRRNRNATIEAIRSIDGIGPGKLKTLVAAADDEIGKIADSLAVPAEITDVERTDADQAA
jgi:hypothetical protein